MQHVPRDNVKVSHDILRLHGHDICPQGIVKAYLGIVNVSLDIVDVSYGMVTFF
jgi:hypothetical protein